MFFSRRRDKSLPRRKTRGQRDQQRKRSLTAQPLLNTPIKPAPATNNNNNNNAGSNDPELFHEGLELLSSARVVQQALMENEARTKEEMH